MVRLKERKLAWALKQKGVKNKELAYICGVKMRRFQQLKAEFKKTGEVPKLKSQRRPKTELKIEDKQLIDKAVEESGLSSTIHNLLKKGITKPDPKKQRQRKYCRYERKHSFSLVHLDWHESKVIPGKWICSVEDDASRLILAGGEFDKALAKHSINLMQQAIDNSLQKYCAIIREANTDKGCQFYANTYNDRGEKGRCEFERFLEDKGIKHIPSRRNHPQTNGKKERWFRTYEEHRGRFKTFEEFIIWYNNKIHVGLNRREPVTPNDVVVYKLRKESLLGLFLRRYN
jgi:putative transposase